MHIFHIFAASSIYVCTVFPVASCHKRDCLVLAVAFVCFGHVWKRKEGEQYCQHHYLSHVLRERESGKSKYRGP